MEFVSNIGNHGLYGGLHGVLLAPLLGELAVLGAVGLEDPGDLGHQGVVGVRVAEQRADGQEHLGKLEVALDL